MNEYINEFEHGIILGCVTGILKLHINSKNFKLTDIMICTKKKNIKLWKKFYKL
tara:strand:+ start:127 stop:288 length:162 start_codon:yes stop_codon:yes gene_type:complete